MSNVVGGALIIGSFLARISPRLNTLERNPVQRGRRMTRFFCSCCNIDQNRGRCQLLIMGDVGSFVSLLLITVRGVRLILRTELGKMTVDEKCPKLIPAIAQDERAKRENSLCVIGVGIEIRRAQCPDSNSR